MNMRPRPRPIKLNGALGGLPRQAVLSRKHPGESLAMAFLAGTLLGAFLGRRS